MVLASVTAFKSTSTVSDSKITARMIAFEKIRHSNLGGAFPSLGN